MKVLLSGGCGQLGKALLKSKPKETNLKACSKSELDICNLEQSRKLIRRYAPDIIINAAAYTAVEKAEEEKEKAYSINADGVRNLSNISLEENIKLIHISTDYVFDGFSNSPYKESDETNPLNIYGKSKLQGEQIASQILGDQLLILRTAWLYSIDSASFLKTMINLLMKKESFNVVDDQYGTPTRTASLARAIYQSIENNISGIFHFTDLGDTTWFGFASAIRELMLEKDPSLNLGVIKPISHKDYPSKMKRPSYSILDKDKILSQIKDGHLHWKDSLELEIKKK